MKILNLYAGIGGNRKLWGGEHEITAIEIDPKIATIYQDFFPNDKVIVADAHQYLLEHFEEFDFIWSSPPCPTHSVVRFVATRTKEGKIRQKPVYPEMSLYQEILLCQYYFKGKYCIENVVGFYEPLIKPQELEKHYWWTNFILTPFDTKKSREHQGSINSLSERKGFNIDKYKVAKRKALRNCAEPEIGLHILECAMGLNRQKSLL